VRSSAEAAKRGMAMTRQAGSLLSPAVTVHADSPSPPLFLLIPNSNSKNFTNITCST